MNDLLLYIQVFFLTTIFKFWPTIFANMSRTRYMLEIHIDNVVCTFYQNWYKVSYLHVIMHSHHLVWQDSQPYSNEITNHHYIDSYHDNAFLDTSYTYNIHPNTWNTTYSLNTGKSYTFLYQTYKTHTSIIHVKFHVHYIIIHFSDPTKKT